MPKTMYFKWLEGSHGGVDVSISICTHMTFSFTPPNPHVGLEFFVLSLLLLPSSSVMAANLCHYVLAQAFFL